MKLLIKPFICSFVAKKVSVSAGMIGAREIGLMKPNAVFINTARPQLVDYDALYDALLGGYGAIECVVTFVSKFAMAWVCGMIAFAGKREAKNHGWNVAASVIGALTYVCLYMLKTFVFQKFVYGFPAETVWATMLSKLPGSLINAVVAMIAAPIVYTALSRALDHGGLLRKMRS